VEAEDMTSPHAATRQTGQTLPAANTAKRPDPTDANPTPTV